MGQPLTEMTHFTAMLECHGGKIWQWDSRSSTPWERWKKWLRAHEMDQRWVQNISNTTTKPPSGKISCCLYPSYLHFGWIIFKIPPCFLAKGLWFKGWGSEEKLPAIIQAWDPPGFDHQNWCFWSSWTNVEALKIGAPTPKKYMLLTFEPCLTMLNQWMSRCVPSFRWD